MRKITVVGCIRSLVCLAFLGPLGGCGGESVDLGEDTTTEEASASLAGHWVASLSSGAFVTGPKLLRLDIDSEGHGTLSVGAVTLEPPTDPSVGFPPEAQADAGEASGLLVHLYEGVEYGLRKVNASDGGLSFEVDAYEAFRPWCELQTPILTSVGYRCRENWGGGVRRPGGQKQCHQVNPATQEQVVEDCLAIWLCSMEVSSGCICTESGCSVSSGGRQTVSRFDLALDETGNTLSGGHSFTNPGALAGQITVGPGVEFTRQ